MSPSNEPSPPVPVPTDLGELARQNAARLARLRAAGPDAARVDALLDEISVALAPVKADQAVDDRAYAHHEHAARVDVLAEHGGFLEDVTDIVAARMAKTYGLRTIRQAADIGDDRYLLARVKGVLAALEQIDPLR